MNEEEKDVYIKGKIKDGYIPEKIDNLFNTSIKIIENKGEEKMEEKKIENTEEKPKMNENSQNQAEKKKMPVALKRILAIVACLMILIGGGNVYATSQGYNNIFFLIIDKLGISKDVSGKDNILSDRDITISYRSIEISEGTLIQINSLVIKDNEAKLKIHVDEKNAKKIITPLTYKVRDENDVELCNYTSVHSQTHTDFKEKLILNNYKNDTKKLILEIYDLNMEKIVELEIDLEKKKINVIGNAEEVTKISEEELKKYLGAFAMLNYNGTEYRDFSKNTVEVENTKKVIAALEIAKIKNINVYTGEKEMHEMEYNLVIDKEKVNNLVQSFTTVELNKEGLIPLDPTGEYLYYPGKINGKNVYIDGDRVRFSPTCLEITDIAYIGGIYNVTFKFCYSLEENKGFETTDTVEKLPVYEMSVGLILDEDSEYSKYRVSSMSEATLVEKGTGENSNETINNAQAQEIIQGFINIISRHEASTTSMLTIEEISLVTQEELTQIYNTAKRDEEGYMKTNIKYSDLKNKMLEYMTEELFETYSYGYKNVDGNLWVLDGGASGYSKKVESIKIISSSENKLTYEVVTLIGTFDEMTESRNEKYELQKHENGRYVVSSWGWHIELKETLQNYLNLSGAYEGSPKALLEKLNLLKTGDISYTNEKADGEGYIKTNIKYSDYKEAMLNYVSENLFNEKFTSLYKEKDGYLYYYDGGGTGMQFEVENVILKDGKYVGIIYDTTWKDETGSKGEKQYKEFGVEEHNGKRVISYYN